MAVFQQLGHSSPCFHTVCTASRNVPSTKSSDLLEKLPMGVPGTDSCPLGGIGLQYPLQIVNDNKKGQRSEKIYLEAVWKKP